jgi:two-component sensor histidine kinase
MLFPGTAAVRFSITLERTDGEELLLTVSDTGMRPKTESVSGAGLGTRLIDGLSRQVGANMETHTGPGFTTVIRVPGAGVRRPAFGST